MKNKGLTLVELIAVLVILSIIALIVTPTITGNIKEYKDEMYINQINAIKDSAYNWAADNIDNLPIDNSYALKVMLKELQDGGYIDDKVKNPKNGGNFNPEETFVLIKCQVIKDDTGQYEDNYKYSYGVYLNNEDYIKQEAIRYAKNNNIDTSQNLTLSQIDIQTNIRTTNGTNESITFESVSLDVSTSKDGNVYNASVKY